MFYKLKSDFQNIHVVLNNGLQMYQMFLGSSQLSFIPTIFLLSSYHLKHFLNNNLNRYEVQCQQSFEEVCHTSYEAKTENVCQDSVKEECKIVHDRQCEPVVETKCRLVKDTTV